MKSLLTITALSCSLLANHPAEAAMKKNVSFESQDQTLNGHLYLPDDYKAGDRLPGVVVTGAWTTVKEQMPSTYAQELADEGFAALVFDFRGWGQSVGGVRYLEDPTRKTEDIHAAVEFLSTLDEVDSGKIAGLGICASAGYMSDAAATNPKIQSLALVAPWLHDKAIVDAVYGGQESVAQLIKLANDSDANSAESYLEATSLSNDKAVMYQAPYYTEADRGLIPEYDNKFNRASWAAWLQYDALQTAEKQTKPALLVHSEAAAIPQGAKEYVQRAKGPINLIMLDQVTQFDFYDQPAAVSAASSAVIKHLNDTL